MTFGRRRGQARSGAYRLFNVDNWSKSILDPLGYSHGKLYWRDLSDPRTTTIPAQTNAQSTELATRVSHPRRDATMSRLKAVWFVENEIGHVLSPMRRWNRARDSVHLSLKKRRSNCVTDLNRLKLEHGISSSA